MNRPGHIGAAALVAAPGLAMTGLILEPPYGLLFAGLCVGVASLPDRVESLTGSSHRGWGHTFLFVALFSTGIGVILGGGVQQSELLSGGVLVGFIATVAIALGLLSHLAADIVTVGGQYRVKPFWPFSERSYQLGWVTADTRMNAILALVGLVALAGAMSLFF